MLSVNSINKPEGKKMVEKQNHLSKNVLKNEYQPKLDGCTALSIIKLGQKEENECSLYFFFK